MNRWLTRLGMMALAVTTGGISLTMTASLPAAAGQSPIVIALITSLTGPAAPQFPDAQAGFLARIDLQNAEGGVTGHKITPLVIDDQSNPTEVATAVQEAISKGALGIVSDSALFYLGAKYAQQRGVPVTGGDFDGPEWGEQPYTNMFSSDNGSINPSYPANLGVANFMRDHGGTVLGTYGYGISPSSTRAALGVADGFKHFGGKVGVLDTTVPFGGVDMTSEALIAKQKGVNAVFPSMSQNTNFSLVESMKQARISPKVVVLPSGYEPSLIGSTTWETVQGDYFVSEFRPFSLPDAGTRSMGAALEKYQNFKSSEFPSFGQYESWAGADLMIKGMSLAGTDLSDAKVISSLRHLKGYNANGLLPYSINYSTIFGHDQPEICDWYLVAKPSGFVPVSSQPICGRDLSGSSTASS
jgi:branched-chain amino acid transport system substrate-binding protein